MQPYYSLDVNMGKLGKIIFWTLMIVYRIIRRRKRDIDLDLEGQSLKGKNN